MVRKVTAAYLLSVACWAIVALLMSVQQREFERDLGYKATLFHLYILICIRFFDFALLTPPLFFIVRRFPVDRKRPVLGVIGYSLGAIPFVILHALPRFTIAPIWDDRFQQFVKLSISLHNMYGIIYGTFGDKIAIYITIVVAAHAYHYCGMVRREELEKAGLQEALAESELQALKNQLLPHFLFNTLHGIWTLIETDRGLG